MDCGAGCGTVVPYGEGRGAGRTNRVPCSQWLNILMVDDEMNEDNLSPEPGLDRTAFHLINCNSCCSRFASLCSLPDATAGAKQPVRLGQETRKTRSDSSSAQHPAPTGTSGYRGSNKVHSTDGMSTLAHTKHRASETACLKPSMVNSKWTSPHLVSSRLVYT